MGTIFRRKILLRCILLQLWHAVHTKALLSSHVEMQFSVTSLFLFLLITSISTLSLLPPLSLISANSTTLNGYSNESFSSPTSKSGIVCSKVYGLDLSTDSCNNAWEKISRTPNSRRFIPRKTDSGKVTPDDVSLPLRYLSDDGACAIVRCLLLSFALLLHLAMTFRIWQACERDKSFAWNCC